MKAVFAVVGAVVIAAGVVIGGWQLGWWMKSYAVNRNARIFQQGYGAQSAYEEELHGLIVQIDQVEVQITAPQTPSAEVAALQAQKQAMVTQGCGIEQKLAMPSAEAQQFAAAECG